MYDVLDVHTCCLYMNMYWCMYTVCVILIMYICMCLLCTCACTVHFDWIEHASSIDMLVFCCLINVDKDVFLMSGNVSYAPMCMYNDIQWHVHCVCTSRYCVRCGVMWMNFSSSCNILGRCPLQVYACVFMPLYTVKVHVLVHVYTLTLHWVCSSMLFVGGAADSISHSKTS